MILLGFCVLGRRPHGKMDCLSHRIMSWAGAIPTAYRLMLILITWSRSRLSGVSTVKLLSSPTSLHCPLARSYFGWLTPEVWGVRPSSLKAEYFHKWCEIHLHGRWDYSSPFIYALNRLFIGVWFMNIYFILQMISQYYFYIFWYSNCSSLEKWLMLALGQEIYTIRISFEPLHRASKHNKDDNIPQWQGHSRRQKQSSHPSAFWTVKVCLL